MHFIIFPALNAAVNSENSNKSQNELNNNSIDNGIAEICDVPDSVANQKRLVSIT